jgi:DNA repair exonuclease SbcCD ATPase subunit
MAWGLSIGHHQPIAVQFVIGEQPMSVEILTYAALGARLNISPEAARSLTRRLRLPHALSDDGKALVSVDFAEIRHTSRPPRTRASSSALLAAKIEALKAKVARLETTAADHKAEFERERERADRLSVELLQATAETTAAQEATARFEALKAEIARLETTAADHKAEFERERERADRLAVELLQATAETTAAQEATARLEDEVAALRTGGQTGGLVGGQGQAARRLGHLAASIVQADRKACR